MASESRNKLVSDVTEWPKPMPDLSDLSPTQLNPNLQCLTPKPSDFGRIRKFGASSSAFLPFRP